MPNQTSNKKIVASKGGRKISTPVGLLFVAVIGLLLAFIGTYSYTKYKERDLKAKAAGWTAISNAATTKNNIQIRACKNYSPIGNDAAAKPGSVTLVISKPKGAKPNVTVNLYKNYPIKGGVVAGQTIKETISSKVVSNWKPIKSVSTSTIRSWWGDEVAAVKLDSPVETITNAKVGLEFTNSTTGKKVTPPYVQSETSGSTTYVRHYYNGYDAAASNGVITTDKAYSAAYRHWVNNYSISVPKITNCN